MQIDTRGNTKYPTYSVRLGEILTGLMMLSNADMTPQNYQILHGLSTETWHEALSAITLDEMKYELSRNRPPTVEQLLSRLPTVTGVWHPGDYLMFILPDTEAADMATKAALQLDAETHTSVDGQVAPRYVDEKEFVYTGSCSLVARGVECRCQQHANPNYRAHEMAIKSCFVYELIDQKDRYRRLEFRLTAQTAFRSGAAADVNGTRALTIVQEQVQMIWLGCTATNALNRNHKYVALSPWPKSAYPYLGANSTAPLKQNSQIALEDAVALTPEEHRERHRLRNAEQRANETDEQKARSAQYNKLYAEKVSAPRREMRAMDYSEAEIAETVQDGLDQVHALLPERTKGSNRRRRPGEASNAKPRSSKNGTMLDDSDSDEPKKITRWYCKRGTRCQYCKEKKYRCDGESPCGRCSKRGFVCKPQQK
ncbi:hypothetical protein HII31_04299 [Pseudocercospora fuligena]|uniref:Zn(2)-C6 fungal-type domain-containing protein n=1 Tax=Pseudocercospora fuligena TaxID=685502 RepID=A0A8H6RKT9_9PEZI|nr:hypothetical protein HII31_04299 [Pseudocercospora fuligena]